MFLKTKKAKIIAILLLGICLSVSAFLYIQNSNINENEEEINHFKPKEYEISDFDHLADDLSEALRVLWADRKRQGPQILGADDLPETFRLRMDYRDDSPGVFEYLASEKYRKLLKDIGPKTNGVFVRLGDWVMEFQTGTVTGFYEKGVLKVEMTGTIDFEKRPMVIKLKVKSIEIE